jgi:diaphanous 1
VTRLPYSLLVKNVIESPIFSNPFSARARRGFRFCVPDEWYRRSKPHSISLQPSGSTIKRTVVSREGDYEADEEGTAKFHTAASHISSSTAAAPLAPPDWRSSISQARLSSLFDVWKRPASPTSPSPAGVNHEKKIVSEPKLVEQHSGSSLLSTGNEATEVDQTFNSADFEQMLVRQSFLPYCAVVLTEF